MGDGDVSMGSYTLPCNTVLGTMKQHVSFGVKLTKNKIRWKKEEKGETYNAVSKSDLYLAARSG